MNMTTEYTSLDELKEAVLRSLNMTQECIDSAFECKPINWEIIKIETEWLDALKYMIEILNIVDTFESPTEYKYKKGDAGRIGLISPRIGLISPFTYTFQDLKRKNRKAHLEYHIKCLTLIINALNITRLNVTRRYRQVAEGYIKINDNYKAALMSL